MNTEDTGSTPVCSHLFIWEKNMKWYKFSEKLPVYDKPILCRRKIIDYIYMAATVDSEIKCIHSMVDTIDDDIRINKWPEWRYIKE